jgi:L-threonylcarbamoyladenylate synthase
MASMHDKMTQETPDCKFSPDMAEQISRGAEVLRSGGIVAYPTDTVYGLGADIYNDNAVKKVFAAKARPLNLPMPVLIANNSDAMALIEQQPDVAQVLMDKFWPGGLTIIFKRNTSLQSIVLAGSEKIGIRVPGHALTRKLIELAGGPIAGTSANLHDKPDALTATEVKSQLGSSVDLIIDGGACPGGIESTIIDVTVNPPAIVRQGIIPLEAINAVIKTGRNKRNANRPWQ